MGQKETRSDRRRPRNHRVWPLRFRSYGFRAVIVGIMLVGFIAATHNFIPVGTVVKDKSIPFPCQDRPCGCTDAAECWRQCCCYTDKEKVLWAIENDVPIPDEVIDRMKARSPKAKASESLPAKTQASAEKCSLACRCKAVESAAASPDSSGSCCGCHSDDTAASCSEGEKKTERKLVFGMFARHCSGNGSVLWLDFTMIVVPRATFDVERAASLVSMIPHYHERPLGCRPQPAVPPPEFSAG